MSKVHYIAHPYTSNIEANLELCTIRCNRLLDLGYTIISPITHSHPLDIAKTRDPNFWYEQDLRILEKLDGIVMMPEWELSVGCNKEIMKAKELGLEILYYEEIIHDNQ